MKSAERNIIYSLIGIIVIVLIYIIISCPKPPFERPPIYVNDPPLMVDPVPPSQNPTITLIVNAHELFVNSSNYQGPFVLEQCSIRDNRGVPPKRGNAIKGFKTPVKMNKPVIWLLKKDIKSNSYNSQYKLGFAQIQRKDTLDNPNYFSENIISGNNGVQMSKMVLNNPAFLTKEYKYDIWFSVQAPNNGPFKYFKIDPKLQGQINVQ